MLWLALALGGQAWAQPVDSPAAAAPSDDQTSAPEGEAERIARAQAIFDQGMELHSQLLFARAVTRYREALELWDHAYIRYAASRALSAMGKNLEAYEDLKRALPGLRDEHRANAERFRQTLLGSLAEIEVRCSEPGAQVTVDGDPWLTCPGSKNAVIQPGHHVIDARKEGYVAVSRPVWLEPGRRAVVETTLMSLEDANVTERRWAQWKTWSVAGAGLALTVTGIYLTREAEQGFNEFDTLWSRICAESGGCVEDDNPALVNDLERAELQNTLGASALVIGGAALVTGVTLTILNRARTYRREDAGGVSIQIVPLLNARGAGVSLSF